MDVTTVRTYDDSEVTALQTHTHTHTHSVRVSKKTFWLTDPIWFRKITTDPNILVHVNIEWRDNWYPKLKTYISALILYKY